MFASSIAPPQSPQRRLDLPHRNRSTLTNSSDEAVANSARGIVSLLTPPGTPQHNGVSERHNRTLLDIVQSMMFLTDLPLSFWGYALETAAFTLNRAPSKSVETMPYELWFGKTPKLSFLKVWGCDAYVKKLQPDKLEPKSENVSS